MNQRRFIIALFLIVIVLGAVSLRTGQTKEKIVFAESTDMLAVTVDDAELTLADLAFYIAYEEGVMEKEAYIYNSEDTGEYWRLYSNHTSLRKAAKAAAMDMAIHDEIFYELAVAEDITLNEEEEQRLSNSEYDFWSDLDEDGRAALGVSEDVIRESMRKLAVAEKYQYIYAATNGEDFDAYSVDGSAYSQLKEEHICVINKNVWSRVPFGSITVDH